jgi:DhnA family fructose-bisphosphate aldolase class Ia
LTKGHDLYTFSLAARATLGKESVVSDFGKRIRMNRILRGQGRGALVVAFDHALVIGPIPGTESPAGQIRQFVDARVDAVLLNLGLLRSCCDSFVPGSSVGLVARIDWTTVWKNLTEGTDSKPLSCMLASPEDALRHGADAVLTYMIVGTGDADFETKEVARNAQVARECERIGIPLIVESLARGNVVTNYSDPKWLKLHTRMAVELGADMIKTDYSGDARSMRSVIQECPIPLLVLGGSRSASEDEALDVVRGAMEAGAAGVFFGRNVFQSEDIGSFLRRARTVLEGTEVLQKSR